VLVFSVGNRAALPRERDQRLHEDQALAFGVGANLIGLLGVAGARSRCSARCAWLISRTLM